MAHTTTPSHAPGPTRRHGETRGLILDAAQQMVQTDSYDGFSFRDVAEAVGIRKASVYHHFETKEALAAAMADRARERFRDWAMEQAARSPAARLEAYCFDLYAEHLGAGQRLCPGASLAAGWSHLAESVRSSVTGLMDVHARFLIEAMREGSTSGELVLPAGTDAEAAAMWFAANVQGALVLARTRGSREVFEQLCRVTLRGLTSGFYSASSSSRDFVASSAG